MGSCLRQFISSSNFYGSVMCVTSVDTPGLLLTPQIYIQAQVTRALHAVGQFM